MAERDLVSEEVEALHCIGCGAVIQTTDKAGIGYTPPSALEKGLETDELYCQRCFRLRHYNEIAAVNISDDEFLRLLTEVGNSPESVAAVEIANQIVKNIRHISITCAKEMGLQTQSLPSPNLKLDKILAVKRLNLKKVCHFCQKLTAPFLVSSLHKPFLY